MTAPEAAKRLKVSIRRVQALCKRGTLRATKRGRDWWITPKAIEAWEAKGRKAGRPGRNA